MTFMVFIRSYNPTSSSSDKSAKKRTFFCHSVTARVNFFYAYLGLQVSAPNSDGLMELIALTAIIARVEKPKSGLVISSSTNGFLTCLQKQQRV